MSLERATRRDGTVYEYENALSDRLARGADRYGSGLGAGTAPGDEPRRTLQNEISKIRYSLKTKCEYCATMESQDVDECRNCGAPR